MNRPHHWKKYLIVFCCTVGIFGLAWYASIRFNQKKIDTLRADQDRVATDLLALETQLDLASELSCDSSAQSVFSDELSALAGKITYSEQNLASSSEIEALKKQYTLLQVRDFILVKRVAERCHQAPMTIFYFYGTKETCPDCAREVYVLDALQHKYPKLRVYSFDYALDLSTIKALRGIYKITDTLPGLVVNGVTMSGFQSLDEVEALLSRSH